MVKKNSRSPKYDKPVAYDAEGKPLYAHPAHNTDTKIQNVHFVRSREPIPEVISDSVRLKHQQSKKTFPELNLSEGEYVIINVKRHPIGLVIPTLLSGFLIIASLAVFLNFGEIVKSIGGLGVGVSVSDIAFPVLLFIIMVLLATYIVFLVYNKNQLFLTNESLIQHIQTSLFAKKERVISLMDIEDVSFVQKGIAQTIFNYGLIRLSTEGEGATYTFSYTPSPKETVASLSNAIEAFKYGRAINQE